MASFHQPISLLSSNTIRTPVQSAFLLPGFIYNAWSGGRLKKARSLGLVDERDTAIQNRASVITLIVLDLIIFTSCIALFEMSAKTGTVSRGWMI